MENKWVIIEDEYGNSIIARRLTEKQKKRYKFYNWVIIGLLIILFILLIGII